MADASTYSSCEPRVTPAMVAECTPSLDLETDAARIEAAIAEVLYLFDLATSFAFRGICTDTIQPLGVSGQCGEGSPGRDEIIGQVWPAWLPPMVPYVVDRVGPLGGPRLANCWYTSACSGADLDRIRLPWLPVRSVVEVRIGPDVLPESEWRLIPGTNLLVRKSGGWPTTQDLAVEPGEVGTWTVKFEHGWPFPPGIGRRLADFAAPIARTLCGQPCQLPDGVRIARKGDEEYVVFDNYRKDGLTGYGPVDDWIMVWRNGEKGTATIAPRMTRPGGRRAGSVRTEQR